MRIIVQGHEVEGSAAEIAALLKLVGENGSGKAVGTDGKDMLSPFVSEDVALAVLTRRPLGDSHAKLLRLLDSAADSWTSAPQLQKALGLSTREFAGAMGALGKRITHTEGGAARSFLDQYWDREKGYNLYRLPPSVQAALRRAKLVP